MLESALLRIAERRQLSGVNVADYKVLRVIESIAHELAHALDLGPDFETSIRAMEDAEADEHEAATLRIEIDALAMLGVRLSARRLWVTAMWRNVKVPLVRLVTPLDRHEKSCAKRFVAMVRREIIKGGERAERIEPGRVQVPETDQERIEWLQADISRLQDVYWYIQNKDGTVQYAIDKLAERQSRAR